MLNHNQTAMVLVIGLVAVLMTLSSTRVFAQPTLPPSQIETPADQHHPIESEITGGDSSHVGEKDPQCYYERAIAFGRCQ